MICPSCCWKLPYKDVKALTNQRISNAKFYDNEFERLKKLKFPKERKIIEMYFIFMLFLRKGGMNY